ncbi:MAG: HigA family addiction module antidote protein [Clostridiales bacterium]|jgi:HTH-type transcriptional regulator/antitoxin HigA|nr:HigA family addiction module antidote protein [Clostridiales bacterium]
MSNKVSQFKPTFLVYPGEILKDSLDTLSMTQEEFAIRTGISKTEISDIIKGKRNITIDMALKFEPVLGLQAQFWNNLQTNYTTHKKRIEYDKGLQDDFGILGKIPYNNIAKYGLVHPTRDRGQKVKNLRSLIGLNSLRDIDKLPMYAHARKSNVTTNYITFVVWVALVEQQAQKVDLPMLDASRLSTKLDDIRLLTLEKPEVFEPKLKSILQDCGIAFVVIPSFQSRTHGAVKKVGENAVIAVTDLQKYSDQFWFTIFHEIGHIVNGDLAKPTFLSADNMKGNDMMEGKANRFAQNQLLPSFDVFKRANNFGKAAIIEYAQREKILPSIVVGRLQYEKLIAWSHCNELRSQYTIVPH